jgi:hypothetical protein
MGSDGVSTIRVIMVWSFLNIDLKRSIFEERLFVKLLFCVSPELLELILVTFPMQVCIL